MSGCFDFKLGNDAIGDGMIVDFAVSYSLFINLNKAFASEYIHISYNFKNLLNTFSIANNGCLFVCQFTNINFRRVA